MKKLILFSILAIALSCGNNTKLEAKSVQNDIQLKKINDSLTNQPKEMVVEKNNIENPEKSTIDNNKFFEDSINETILVMQSQKNTESIDLKIKEIEADTKISKKDKTYWKAYLLYEESIFYKKQLKDDDKASNKIDIAISILEENAKTSEDYALLAACTSFSIQFANMTQLGKISAKVEELAIKSLELNSKNLRAYYILASHNYYTPKMFGGMTKVEEYSLKGLACPERLDDNFYSPKWGKSRLYSIYISFLENEKREEDANKYKEIMNNSK